MSASPAARRPRVLLTLDRSVWHRLGLGRLTYGRSLRQAGARLRIVDESELWREAVRSGQQAPARPLAAATSPWSAAQHGGDLEVCRRLLDGMQGLVLSGGGDLGWGHADPDPNLFRRVRHVRDRLEFALFEVAKERGLPVLGLCRGAQLLAVASGGQLHSLRSGEAAAAKLRCHRNGRGHTVALERGSLLQRIYGTQALREVLSHHAHAAQSVGDEWAVTGRAPDGVIEAFEWLGGVPGDGRKATPRAETTPGWRVGVQWHAELPIRNARRRALWRAFVEEAARVAAQSTVNTHESD